MTHRLMLMCNYCLQFYHLDCAGLEISEKEANAINIYMYMTHRLASQKR